MTLGIDSGITRWPDLLKSMPLYFKVHLLVVWHGPGIQQASLQRWMTVGIHGESRKHTNSSGCCCYGTGRATLSG